MSYSPKTVDVTSHAKRAFADVMKTQTFREVVILDYQGGHEGPYERKARGHREQKMLFCGFENGGKG